MVKEDTSEKILGQLLPILQQLERKLDLINKVLEELWHSADDASVDSEPFDVDADDFHPRKDPE